MKKRWLLGFLSVVIVIIMGGCAVIDSSSPNSENKESKAKDQQEKALTAEEVLQEIVKVDRHIPGYNLEIKGTQDYAHGEHGEFKGIVQKKKQPYASYSKIDIVWGLESELSESWTVDGVVYTSDHGVGGTGQWLKYPYKNGYRSPVEILKVIEEVSEALKQQNLPGVVTMAKKGDIIQLELDVTKVDSVFKKMEKTIKSIPKYKLTIQVDAKTMKYKEIHADMHFIETFMEGESNMNQKMEIVFKGEFRGTIEVPAHVKNQAIDSPYE